MGIMPKAIAAACPTSSVWGWEQPIERREDRGHNAGHLVLIGRRADHLLALLHVTSVA